MDKRRHTLWSLITALLIGLPVLYVLSFGPACWVTSRTETGAGYVSVIYRPIVRCLPDGEGPRWADHPTRPVIFWPAGKICWYAELWAAPGWRWRVTLVRARGDWKATRWDWVSVPTY